MERFSPDVPAGLWEKIETGLVSGKVREEGKTIRLRAKSSWWAAAAVVLTVGLMSYWFTRPAETIYLHGKTAAVKDTAAVLHAAGKEGHNPTDTSASRMVSVETVAARKTNRPGSRRGMPPTLETPDKIPSPEPVLMALPLPAPPKNDPKSIPVPDSVEMRIVEVPDLQPPVVLEDVEEEMLASTAQTNPLGVSRLLNFLVGAVDTREEKAVTFSSDSEGSLKIEFNLARNRKRK